MVLITPLRNVTSSNQIESAGFFGIVKDSVTADDFWFSYDEYNKSVAMYGIQYMAIGY